MDGAGAGFPVGEMNLGRVEIDMLPAQGQDFVSAAARQHQQADRRDRAGGYPAALARDFVEHMHPRRVNSVSVRNRSRFRLGFIGMNSQGSSQSSGAMSQPLASAYMWLRVSTVMFAIAGVSHRLSCSAMTCRRSTAAIGSLPSAGTMWRLTTLRAVRCVFGLQRTATLLFEIAVGQVGHRRAACVLRRERKGNRVLPGLDPRDDECGPLARLLGAEHRVAADRYPPRLVRLVRPVRTARLGDEDLTAGRIDPDPEASELAIPEHRVALDAQRRDGAVGERPVLQYRHRLRRLGGVRREVGADAVAGAGGGGLLGVVHEMGIAGGGADLGMTEDPADHGQALAERERPGGVAVSQVMDAHALQPGMRLDAVPVVGEVRQAGAGLLAPDDPGIALDPFDAVEHLQEPGSSAAPCAGPACRP